MFRKHPIPGIAILLAFVMCMFIPVYADSGPKPSLAIRCEGFPDNAYITVLSTVRDYGPNQAMDELDFEIREDEWYEYAPVEKDVYISFARHAKKLKEAGEQLYFWGVVSSCADEYLFGYWPPEEFRILIWLKDTDEFILSEDLYARQAFRTILRCDYSSGRIQVSDISSADISGKGILFRILLTIAVEYAAGLLFMKYTFRSRMTVAAVNVVTQIILNVCLSQAALKFGTGMPAYVMILVLLEMLIILAEYLVYRKVIGKELSAPLVYSLTANILSFAVGIVLSSLLPALFV